MKKLTLLAAAAVAAAAPAAAQLPNVTPFSFEARAGLAVPTGDLKDLGDAEAGLSLSGSVTYHALPMVGIYAGYSRSQFGVEGVDDASYTDQGIALGVRAGIPTPLIPIDPWIRAGVVNHALSSEGLGEDEVDTDHGWGFEVGAGLGFAFTNKVSITPGVTYTSYSPENDVDISHLRVDVGVRVRL